MDSTRYRDAILNSSAIWKYVILLSLEQDVLISLEYALLINHPYEYPFRAPQHCQSKIRLIWDAYNLKGMKKVKRKHRHLINR